MSFLIQDVTWKKDMQNLKINNLISAMDLQKEKVAQHTLQSSITGFVRNNTSAYKNYLEILLLGPTV